MPTPAFAPFVMPPADDPQAIGDWSQHVFISTPNYTIEGHIYDTRSLVITFENAGATNHDDPFRLGWGAKRFRTSKTSHICIKPKAADWYQHPDLAQAFTTLRDTGFFAQFRHRLTYGGSMGGFAALAYADLVQATTVLALNPQSTLAPDLAGWDKRFPQARAQDWSGPYKDAAGLARTPTLVLVAYDPFTPLDAKHIARLDQPALTLLRAPFWGMAWQCH